MHVPQRNGRPKPSRWGGSVLSAASRLIFLPSGAGSCSGGRCRVRGGGVRLLRAGAGACRGGPGSPALIGLPGDLKETSVSQPSGDWRRLVAGQAGVLPRRGCTARPAWTAGRTGVGVQRGVFTFFWAALRPVSGPGAGSSG